MGLKDRQTCTSSKYDDNSQGSSMVFQAVNNRSFWLLKNEANLTVIASDCDRCISGFADFSWFLISAPVLKEAACQRNQTPATVNNDKSNRQAHELIPWQAPPIPRQSGRELQSGDTALLVICYNRGLTRFVWFHRPLSTAARATGSQSSSVCLCGRGCRVCVCVWDGSPAGKGSLVCRFSALIGLNEWSFCCSAESLHLSSSLSSQRGSKITLLQLETWHHLRPDACLHAKDAHDFKLLAFKRVLYFRYLML